MSEAAGQPVFIKNIVNPNRATFPKVLKYLGKRTGRGPDDLRLLKGGIVDILLLLYLSIFAAILICPSL